MITGMESERETRHTRNAMMVVSFAVSFMLKQRTKFFARSLSYSMFSPPFPRSPSQDGRTVQHDSLSHS